jgi:hypothetical protein
MAHAGGRPPYYTNPDEMQKIIDQYFINCEGKTLLDADGNPVLNKYDEPIIIGAKPPTVTGLCLALGFNSRDALIDYGNKDEYADTVSRAKLRCHEYAESRLYDKDGANGAKFSLANNFGWIDRQEIITHDAISESIEDIRNQMAQIDAEKQRLLEGVKVPYSIIDDCRKPIVIADTDKEQD